jgi:hypothetical protein
VRNSWWPPRGVAGRGPSAWILIAVVAVVAIGLIAVSAPLWAPSGATPTASAQPSDAASPVPTAPPPSATAPGVSPSPEATPGIVLVPAPMTGLLVTPEAAMRQPMAVMIDDHQGARPQSGFNSAAIVWQAPAEGGIPRYMLIFQDTVPAAVGPVRSARQYFIEWAAEWDAMYAHAGGSPQALDTLRRYGRGQLVWNADEFRWSSAGYFWRVHDRVAPHNLYTDGAHLRKLAGVLGMEDGPISPIWGFTLHRADVEPPTGNVIKVVYPYESITYRYDPVRNAYLRYINGSKRPQIDAADRQVVAPKNVILLRMHFGPLADSDPKKHRLEAADVGHGEAWISTGGRTIKGTWRKASAAAPTLLFDSKGVPVTLTAGQTFVQVLPLTYTFSITNGRFAVPMESIPGRGVLTPS